MRLKEFEPPEGYYFADSYEEKGVDGKPLFTRLGCILCPMRSAREIGEKDAR